MIEKILGDAELIDAARAARPDVDAEAVVARVTWNVLAEPGDGAAGALIAEFGATDALRYAFGDVMRSGLRSPRSKSLDDALARWRPRISLKAVGDAIAGARHVAASLLLPGDELWPASLDDLGYHVPSMLWVRGDSTLLSAEPRVAMVGARASSTYGELLAAEFAGDLAATGAVIVSGGAYGIDGAAHRAALAVGGATVAFLAGGVDRAYPQGHRSLLAAIAESGAVVSEVPCGTTPSKWRFLSRNRLIAALGDATVVVEAGWRSGSLNTAGHAAALGRPLAAVPGPVTSAASAGCHRLMREYDARCVTSTAEIRELWTLSADSFAEDHGLDPDRVRLLDALPARAPADARELARRSGLSPERVTALLGLLQLEGSAVRSGAGWHRAAATRSL